MRKASGCSCQWFVVNEVSLALGVVENTHTQSKQDEGRISGSFRKVTFLPPLIATSWFAEMAKYLILSG